MLHDEIVSLQHLQVNKASSTTGASKLHKQSKCFFFVFFKGVAISTSSNVNIEISDQILNYLIIIIS